MRKNVLTTFSASLLSLCLLLSVSLTTKAQDDCVDYDIGSYPKNVNGISYQWNPIWNFTNLKQVKRTGLNISNGNFKGLLEYLPASYNAPGNEAKKYPVIIYFHGGASIGTGTSAHLCRLFKDRGSDLATHLSIPGRVERSTSMFTQSAGESTMEFIVISPQFSQYTRPVTYSESDPYPSAREVEDVINYIEQQYRIDKRRIYLTGLSNGANMITEYAASSIDRAKRVAAIMPVALCSQLDHISNTSRNIDAKNIGLAKLKTWFVYCEIDGCGASGSIAATDKDVPNNWVTAISSVAGAVPPRYTILTNSGSAVAQLYNCSDSLLHDAWSRAYDPNFKASFNYPSGFGSPATRTNDGKNQNVYEWFAESQSAILPVTLKEFTARLTNNKVELKWITTDEKDNASFTIERAGADQKFSSIGSIPGAGDNAGEKIYTFTDAPPLYDLSFYRLIQTDIDGKKTYFEIRRILNQKNNINSVIVSPNPFTTDLSAFITVDKSQKVVITLTDMNGRILKATSGIYSPGSTEIKLKSTDLAKGVYLLKISGENFSTSKKVIKN
jgi:predicted esterase